MNGKPVRTVNELRNLEGLLPLGATVQLTVERKGSQKTLSLRVAATERQRLHAGDLDKRLNGIGLSDPSDATPAGPDRGVAVTGLYPERSAAAARLRQGDILLSINHAPVSRISDVSTLLKNTGPGQQLLLTFSRKNQQFYLLLN